MKKVILLVATATLTRGGALVVNGSHMIRSSERIALGITLPQQAIGRSITVNETTEKTPSGLSFCTIDAAMINENAAIRVEIVRVHQNALRNANTQAQPDEPVIPTPEPVKPEEVKAEATPAAQTV